MNNLNGQTCSSSTNRYFVVRTYKSQGHVYGWVNRWAAPLGNSSVLAVYSHRLSSAHTAPKCWNPQDCGYILEVKLMDEAPGPGSCQEYWAPFSIKFSSCNRNTGTQEHRNTGTLEHWNTGTQDLCLCHRPSCAIGLGSSKGWLATQFPLLQHPNWV